MSKKAIVFDAETKSRADLTSVGAWRYSEHESTDILNFAYKRLGVNKPPAVWHPGDPMPLWIQDRWWEQGWQIEAHSSLFEYSIYHNICVKRWGWPTIPLRHWACTASRAAACALPRALADVGEALDLPVKKNEEGRIVMLQLTKPRYVKAPITSEYRGGEPEYVTKARKAYITAKEAFLKNEFPGEYQMDPDGSIVRWYTPESEKARVEKEKISAQKRLLAIEKQRNKLLAMTEDEFYEAVQEGIRLLRPMEVERNRFEVLDQYVQEDVLAEEALSLYLDELTDYERAVWELDQKINVRGFKVDIPSVDLALKIIDAFEVKCNQEVKEITGGFLETTGQVEKLLQFVQPKGVPLENCQADTIDALLNDKDQEIPEDVRKLLNIRRSLGKSSTKKLYAMKESASPEDDKIRGSIVYFAASTGRFGGKGVQPQNLVKPTIEIDYDKEFELLKDEKAFLEKYPDPMEALSSMLRGFIVSSEGKKFLSSDFNSIEARVLAWLADAEGVLDIFRNGGCIYCYNAGKVYKKKITKEEHPFERSVGKTLTLAAGFQGWVGAFRQMEVTLGVDLKMSDEEVEEVVKAWRKSNKEITDFWKATEEGAIEALITNRKIVVGKTAWEVKGDFLTCILPSGRRLYYYKPALVDVERFGKIEKKLSFLSVHSKTKQWVRDTTYSGHLVQNIVQGVARDLLVNALLKLEEKGYEVVIHTHDDICAEVNNDFGSIEELEKIMCDLPEWAFGLPLEASGGWEKYRYQK